MKRHRPKTSPAVSSLNWMSPNRGDPAVRKRYLDLVFGAALVAVTVLIYQPAWHGKPLLDDIGRFMISPEQRSWRALARLSFQPRTTLQYHPVERTMDWIEGSGWGEQVFGYDLTTYAVH